MPADLSNYVLLPSTQDTSLRIHPIHARLADSQTTSKYPFIRIRDRCTNIPHNPFVFSHLHLLPLNSAQLCYHITETLVGDKSASFQSVSAHVNRHANAIRHLVDVDLTATLCILSVRGWSKLSSQNIGNMRFAFSFGTGRAMGWSQ
jgi:hypothetical protein